MEPVIVQVFSTKRFDSDRRNWGELFALYSDGTWEKLFEYQWSNPLEVKVLNAGRLKNKTRSEAITVLEKEYYSGKLEGVFTK